VPVWQSLMGGGACSKKGMQSNMGKKEEQDKLCRQQAAPCKIKESVSTIACPEEGMHASMGKKRKEKTTLTR